MASSAPSPPQTAATQIAAGANFPSIGNLCQRFGTTTQATKAILDFLVTSGATRASGKINLNTVSQDVLLTLPGITPDIAQGIISRQSQGFASLGDLTDVPGLNSGASLATLADLFTVVSSSFVVRVVGEAGNARVALEATIDVQNGTPKVVRIDDAPFNDMPTRWGWVQETTNTETVLLQGK